MNYYSKLTFQCSKREYSTFDIRRKLKSWGVEAGEMEQIIKDLKENSFLSDQRYANAYIRDKSLIFKWGRRKIEYNLLAKAIGKDITSAIFDGLYEESADKLRIGFEQSMQRKYTLIVSKYDLSLSVDKHKLRAALLRYGLGRGYEYDEVMKELFVLVR